MNHETITDRLSEYLEGAWSTPRFGLAYQALIQPGSWKFASEAGHLLVRAQRDAGCTGPRFWDWFHAAAVEGVLPAGWYTRAGQDFVGPMATKPETGMFWPAQDSTGCHWEPGPGDRPAGMHGGSDTAGKCRGCGKFAEPYRFMTEEQIKDLLAQIDSVHTRGPDGN